MLWGWLSKVVLYFTLVHEMRRREEVRFGLATMCIGVGQGIDMVVERADGRGV